MKTKRGFGSILSNGSVVLKLDTSGKMRESGRSIGLLGRGGGGKGGRRTGRN